MRNQFSAVLLLMIFGLFVSHAKAQTEVPTRVTDQNRTGDLPFSTSVGTSIEHVDATTGALNITLPMIKTPGRGMDWELNYRWNSNYFLMAPRTDGQGRPFWLWTIPVNSGWQTNHTYHTSTHFSIACDGNTGTFYGNDSYIYSDPAGASHSLAMQYETGPCSGPGNANGNTAGPDLTGMGMLGTGATAQAYTSKVLLADGSIEDYQDSNGNQENNGTGDTLGRTPVTIQTTSSNGNLTQTVYTYTDSNGSSQTYTINWRTISVVTNFGVSSDGWGPVTEGGNYMTVISNMVLPNGQTYAFKYEDGTGGQTSYGEITEIDLPDGGVINYTWANLSDFRLTRRYVASRTETVNGVSSTWNFAVSATYSDYDESTYTSTVTYPAVGSPPVQNQSVFTSYAGGVKDAKIYAGTASGTPLREYAVTYAVDSDPTVDDACYNPSSDLPPLRTQAVGLRPTIITTILEDGKTQAQRQIDYETFTYTYYPNHCTDTLENNYVKTYTTSRGNVSEIREYDWGFNAPGPLLRRTKKTYLHSSGNPGYTNYLSRNIVNKVLTDMVCTGTATCNGSGDQTALTQYEYDNYVAGTNALINTSGTPAPQHDYTNYSSTFTYRGNVTRVKRWRNTDGVYITDTYTYDDLGNIRAIADPLGHTTSWSYADSWYDSHCPVQTGYTGQAYPTQMTDALSHLVQVSYYQCTGLKQAHKDQNDITAGRTGTLFSYDLLGRPTLKQDTHLSTGSFGQTTNTYNDIAPVSVTTNTTVTSALSINSVATKDGLGRLIQPVLTSDPDGATQGEIGYDALGRKATASNPHRTASLPSDGTSTNNYDALSRVISVLQADGSQSFTSYALNCSTVTDEAGKKRKSCADGLGRLTQVLEDPTTLNYETDYQYDVLGNLTSATQKGGDPNSANWRVRTFTYDSLSRLVCAANPEVQVATCPSLSTGTFPVGATVYSYDLAGNLVNKTAPKANQTTASVTTTLSFCYDSVNRLTAKSYTLSATCTSPAASYFYDQTSYNGLTIANGVGRRTGMSDGSGSTAWSYDALGGVLIEQRTINGSTSLTKTTTYTYNLDESVATITYPSGRMITYTPSASGGNTASRPSSAVDVAHSISYVTQATYTPHGALFTFSNGSSISGAQSYNSRLQPMQLYYTTGTISPTTISQIQTAACPTTAATIMSRSYNFNLGTTDNGTVALATDCLVTNRTQHFDYDNLNRLKDAYTTGTTTSMTNWGETYTIDPWGNLTNIALYPGQHNSEMLNAAPASAKNQLNGFCHDAAGNLLGASCTVPTYAYDAENRLTATAGFTYVYDGDGQRVIKCSGTYPTCASGTLYWTGTGSGALDETSWTGTQTEEYIFFDGKRVARRDGTGNTVEYYFGDQVGSATVITGSTGGIQKVSMYYPYGGEISVTGPGFANNYKFTGKERDAESTLDDFGARFYASSTGRFLTPDWAARATAVPYAVFGDPQSLNLYGYVRNDPVSSADADGHAGAGVTDPEIRPLGTSAAAGAADPANSVSPDEADQEQKDARRAQGLGQQPAQNQLSEADVSKVIKQTQGSPSDPITASINTFNGLGNNATVSGDTLRAALKDNNIQAKGDNEKLLNNIDSISKSGDSVTINNHAKLTAGLVTEQKTVSFKVGTLDGHPAIKDIQGIAAGKSFIKFDVHSVGVVSTSGRQAMISIHYGGFTFQHTIGGP